MATKTLRAPKRTVKNFSKDHYERDTDEVFLGNFSEEEYETICWETKRKGNIAYDEDGQEILQSDTPLFPVFIKQPELKEKDERLLNRLLP